MVGAAEWHGELIADFAPQRPALRELEMMRVRRTTAAGEAGLGAHELQMVSIPWPHWFGQWGDLVGSCVNKQCILVRRAGLRRAIAVELASRLGFLACWNWLAVKSSVAICSGWNAVAVGLGSRAAFQRIGI